MDQAKIRTDLRRTEFEQDYDEWLRIRNKIEYMFELVHFSYWQEDVEVFIDCSFYIPRYQYQILGRRVQDYLKLRKFGKMPKFFSFSDLIQMTYAIAADRACMLDLTPEISQNQTDGDTVR